MFGRVINILALAQTNAGVTQRSKLWLLPAAWVVFGFFTIACGMLVALYADRLAQSAIFVLLNIFNISRFSRCGPPLLSVS